MLGNFLLWIQSRRTGSRQKVRLNNEFSDWCDVFSGVSHGSVLGPLLFLIYINDIDEYIVFKLEKFADDTKLYKGISNTNDADIFRSDLNKIYQCILAARKANTVLGMIKRNISFKMVFSRCYLM